MGKLKKSKKNNRARVNPIKARPETTAAEKSQVLPLITKLKSADAKEKAMAMGTLNILAEDAAMRKVLLKERLVPTVMEYCLNDNNQDVVVEGFGLLRNMAIEEGYDIIKFLWRQNIWAAVEAALQTLNTTFTTQWGELQQSEKQLAYSLCENVLSLIVVMATGDEVIFESVFQKIDPILNFIVSILAQPVSAQLVHACLDFIYEFSTESSDFIGLLNKANNLDLNKLDASGDRLTSVYIDGIKFNTMEVPDHTVCGQILLSLYDTCSSIDLSEVVSALSTSDQQPISGEVTKDMHAAPQQQARADLRALEVSLDLITQTMEVLSINHKKFNAPVQLGDDLVANVLIAKVWPMVCEIIKFELAHDGQLYLLNRALFAMNNFCWLMLSNNKLPVKWFEVCGQGWDLVEEVVAKSSSSSSVDLQKTTLSIMWAIAKALGPQVQPKVQKQMVESLIQKVQSLNSADEEVVELALSIMGLLGSVTPLLEDVNLVAQVGEFLMSTAESSVTVVSPQATQLVVESLNVMFDIFGDETSVYEQPVFVEKNYLTRMEALEPKVKAMFKKVDRNRFSQLKVAAEEVWTNLGRFIEYKKSL